MILHFREKIRASFAVLLAIPVSLFAAAPASAADPPAEPASDAEAPGPEAAPEPGAEAQAEPEEITSPSSDGPGDDPSVVRARQAFRLGSTLARQGQWRDALAAFERAAALKPHAVTTYNIGYVERALGHLTRARKFLTLAIDEGLPPDLVSQARSYLVEVNQNLARVFVTLDGEDVAIAIDGRPLEVVSQEPGRRPLMAAGTASPGGPAVPPAPVFDLLIDPGAHVIVLSAPAREDAVRNETFEKGATIRLRLSLEPEPAAPPPAPVTAPPPPADAAPARSSLRPWMWTAYGVGAAGIVAGSVFGILAINKDSDLEGVCNPGCPEDRQDDIDRLDLYTMGANIGFGVGIAGTVAGTVLLLTRGDSGSEEQGARPRFSASASVSPQGVSVRGVF